MSIRLTAFEHFISSERRPLSFVQLFNAGGMKENSIIAIFFMHGNIFDTRRIMTAPS